MSTERILGELLANQKMHGEDIAEIKRDVKSLNEFRWKWLGKLAAYSGIVATLASLASIAADYIFFRKG